MLPEGLGVFGVGWLECQRKFVDDEQVEKISTLALRREDDLLNVPGAILRWYFYPYPPHGK